ncbi:hypothetical protein LIER_25529 [Lithospermum erythrorhizon]|uniref:Uncharacterized protein n=1 Tax=Lithospermum erythrorhizon TaxID=34254 RepID=A0AAV3R5C2_LITER
MPSCPFSTKKRCRGFKDWAQVLLSSTKSLASGYSESVLYQHAMELDGDLARERAKVDRLREQLEELHPQVVAVEHLPWESYLMAQVLRREEERRLADLHRAKKRRVAALRALQDARRDKDDLYHANRQEIPLWNC